jgi:hypothetical protein
MAVFWVVAPCCMAEVYRRFRSACCLITMMMEAANTSETSVNFRTGARSTAHTVNSFSLIWRVSYFQLSQNFVNGYMSADRAKRTNTKSKTQRSNLSKFCIVAGYCRLHHSSLCRYCQCIPRILRSWRIRTSVCGCQRGRSARKCQISDNIIL